MAGSGWVGSPSPSPLHPSPSTGEGLACPESFEGMGVTPLTLRQSTPPNTNPLQPARVSRHAVTAHPEPVEGSSVPLPSSPFPLDGGRSGWGRPISLPPILPQPRQPLPHLRKRLRTLRKRKPDIRLPHLLPVVEGPTRHRGHPNLARKKIENSFSSSNPQSG